ncbi:DNA-binding protein [Orf virus]|nr:DNA-binding protein [Orf virus]WGU15119.1 DNA-binding protein [Orf virus]
MLLYPKKARDAAAALAKKNFCAEKLSRAQLLSLLPCGLHGDLPMSVYDEAVAASPANVMFFQPQHVRLPDLITALKSTRGICKKMMPAVCFHRRALLAANDIEVLEALLKAGLVYEPEVVAMVGKGRVSAVFALTCAPWTACAQLKLSRTEVETVCHAIDPALVNDMIPKLEISPEDLVALADGSNIPPLNRALRSVDDVATCARLVCEWPYFNVIKFLDPSMVASREFAQAVREGAMALCVRPVGADRMVGISKSRSRRLPEEHVDFHYEEADTADSCSRSFSTQSTRSFSTQSTRSTRSARSSAPSTHSTETDTADPDPDLDESRDEVGPLTRRFTMTSFCQRPSMRSSSASMRLHARGSFRASEPLMRSAARVPKASVLPTLDTAEELMWHLGEEWRKGRHAKTATLEKLLQDFRLNATFPRTMLASEAPNELKRKMLKVVCGWQVTGEPSSAATAAIEGSTDSIMALLITEHGHVGGLISLLSKPPLPPGCGCEFCARHTAPGRSALRSASLTGATPANELDDAAILAAVFDVTLLAMHGVVDPCFAGSVCWGPLSCALSGARHMDAQRVVEALDYEKLIFANISCDGVKDTNALVRLSRLKISDFVPDAHVLNTRHAQALIAVGCVAEYLLAAVFFRVTVLRRMSKIREFVAKVVSVAMEATGTTAPSIKVHDRVETEIRECSESGEVPFCTIGLVLRTVLAILESLFGDGGD